MALTIISSDSVRMSTGTNVIYASTTTSGVFKFRFYLEIEYFVDGETTTKKIYFTQPKNSQGKAIFNMIEIYKNMVTPMIRPSLLENEKNTSTPAVITSIHTIPIDSGLSGRLYSEPFLDDATGYGAFQGNCNKAVLSFSEMYSTTANGIPEIQGSAEVVTQWIFYGRGERNQKVSEQFTSYDLQNSTKQWLTNNYKYNSSISRWEGYLGRSDYMTMAFFNGHVGNAASDTYSVLFQYFDKSGSQLGTALTALNEGSSGGTYGGTDGSSNTGRSIILFIGAGLQNLDSVDTSDQAYSGDIPSVAESGGTDIAYYDMWMKSSTGAQKSRKYRFYITTPCERYEETRLAYLNKFGCWEYINLNKEKKNTYKVKRDTITKPIISGDIPTSTQATALQNTYPVDVAKQGVMVTNVHVDEELSLFTQNLDDSELDRINDLIMSPQIHWLKKQDAISLICKSNKIDTKIKGKSKLFSYELKFKFSDPKFRTI